MLIFYNFIFIFTSFSLTKKIIQVHEYLRPKLCSLYENDCIFDKFECCWSGTDQYIMTGAYNNFFRMFDRAAKRDVTLEASKEIAKPKTILKPRKVCILFSFNLYNCIIKLFYSLCPFSLAINRYVLEINVKKTR